MVGRDDIGVNGEELTERLKLGNKRWIVDGEAEAGKQKVDC